MSLWFRKSWIKVPCFHPCAPKKTHQYVYAIIDLCICVTLIVGCHHLVYNTYITRIVSLCYLMPAYHWHAARIMTRICKQELGTCKRAELSLFETLWNRSQFLNSATSALTLNLWPAQENSSASVVESEEAAAASMEPKQNPEEDLKARRLEAIEAKALEIEKVMIFVPILWIL